MNCTYYEDIDCSNVEHENEAVKEYCDTRGFAIVTLYIGIVWTSIAFICNLLLIVKIVQKNRKKQGGTLAHN